MRTHTKTFHIRFTEKEYERLCKHAEKAGLPKTTYIRHMINGCRPKEHPPVDYFRFMRELYQLGSSLDQLVNLAQIVGSVHTEKLIQCERQVNDIIKLITQRIIAPDDLDIRDTLEQGRQLAEKEEQSADD